VSGTDPRLVAALTAQRAVAELLGAVGERLQADDRLITGSVVRIPIEPGDEVVADLGPLGRAAATVSRR
jgi:2-keto-4-pentenoate hydratase